MAQTAAQILLKDRFNALANDYVKEFIEVMGFDINPDTLYWVGDETGGVVEIADMFLSYDDIRYVVDNNVSYEELVDWYDYCTEPVSNLYPKPNLKSWHHGCPRLSKKQVQELIERQERIDDLKRELNELAQKYQKKEF